MVCQRNLCKRDNHTRVQRIQILKRRYDNRCVQPISFLFYSPYYLTSFLFSFLYHRHRRRLVTPDALIVAAFNSIEGRPRCLPICASVLPIQLQVRNLIQYRHRILNPPYNGVRHSPLKSSRACLRCLAGHRTGDVRFSNKRKSGLEYPLY